MKIWTMKRIYSRSIIIAAFIMLGLSSCNKDENVATTPSIITAAVTNITEVSATVGAKLVVTGSSAVSERGVCWATTPNPTVDGSKVVFGQEAEEFTVVLTNLKSGTTYYTRAYAISSSGVGYGDQRSFTTAGQLSMTLPLIERFSGSQFLPQHWQMIDQDGDGDAWYAYTSRFKGAISDSDGATPYNFLISPKITISGTSPKLEWNVGATSINYPKEQYKVIVADQAFTAANCTSIGTIVFEETLTAAAGRTLAPRSVDLSAYVGKDVYVAWVHYNCTDQDGLVVTDVRIGSTEHPATVSKASLGSLVVSNLTKTSATVSTTMTNDGGVSVFSRGFCYSLSSNPTTADSKMEITVSVSTAAAMSANLTLNTGTTYYVRAYAENAAGVVYGEQQEITTPSVIKTVLFTEDFANRDPFTAAGSQWVLIDKDADGKSWFYFDDSGGPDHCARSRSYESGASLTPENYMVLPSIVLPADADVIELTFKVAASDDTDFEEVYAVLLSSSAIDINNCRSATVIKAAETLTANESEWAFAERTVDISAYKGQTVYISFVHKDCTGQASLLVGNIQVASYK